MRNQHAKILTHNSPLTAHDNHDKSLKLGKSANTDLVKGSLRHEKKKARII